MASQCHEGPNIKQQDQIKAFTLTRHRIFIYHTCSSDPNPQFTSPRGVYLRGITVITDAEAILRAGDSITYDTYIYVN